MADLVDVGAAGGFVTHFQSGLGQVQVHLGKAEPWIQEAPGLGFGDVGSGDVPLVQFKSAVVS